MAEVGFEVGGEVRGAEVEEGEVGGHGGVLVRDGEGEFVLAEEHVEASRQFLRAVEGAVQAGQVELLRAAAPQALQQEVVDYEHAQDARQHHQDLVGLLHVTNNIIMLPPLTPA